MQKTIGRVMVVASVLALAVGSTACSSRDGSESATGITGPSSAEARGGGGKPSGGSSGSSTLTLRMVTDNNGNGAPDYGDVITFDVSTSATTEPHVDLKCSQNGAVVLGATAGFYDSYPWPWTKIMTLSSQSWTGGEASCTATLYYFSGKSNTTLATLNFNAGA
jgi:hypothetical protein